MKQNNKDNFIANRSHSVSNDNFFAHKNNPFNNSFMKNVSEPNKRLNDYDSNILEKDAYKEISDDAFKIEYKISKLEEELKKTLSQIKSAEEIEDSLLLNELKSRMLVLEQNYNELMNEYNKKSLSTKFSNKLFIKSLCFVQAF